MTTSINDNRSFFSIYLVLCLFAYEIFVNFGILFSISSESSIFSYIIRALVLILTLYLLPKLLKNNLNRKVSIYLICYLSFWFWYFCRLSIDSLLDPGALRLTYIEYLSLSIFVCALPSLVCFSITYQGGVKNFETWLSCLLLFGGLLVLWSFYTSPIEIDLEKSQLKLPKLNATSVSLMGLTLVIAAVFSFIKNAKDSFFKNLFILIAGTIIGLILLGFGGSRAAFLELIIGGFLLMIVFRSKLSLGFSILFPLVFFFIGFGIFQALKGGIFLVLSSRIEDGGLLQDDNRLDYLKVYFEAFLDAPILGAGTEPLGWYSHNLVLDAFLGNGIFFGLLVCFLIILVGLYSMRLILFRADLSLIPILYILACMSVMVSGNIYESNAFWVLMSSSAGLYFGWQKEAYKKHA